ncbi:hypothetical protein MKW94_008219 [Papaver nudicaule]|uniref:Uncharacterized protein n=1 Tax=Papaver nudicaule TaxID=74823 RepID=A0AA42B1B5_PAPNU|nr:hypothetical protein [Papaver nudicaule]
MEGAHDGIACVMKRIRGKEDVHTRMAAIFGTGGSIQEKKCMLSNLGLQNYETNFKKGLLTDTTIPLLTESTLRDVRVPLGPRILILGHIAIDPELKNMQRSSVG